MTIPATKAMMLLLSHCSLVILRSARMDFDKGEKEYHAENEQPVDKSDNNIRMGQAPATGFATHRTTPRRRRTLDHAYQMG
jgi:hypothetical protein